MTDGEAPITSDTELSERIQALLRRAHDGGVDVEGGWSCRNGGDLPDWDVVVTTVRKKGASEPVTDA